MSNLTEATGAIVDVLGNFTTEERLRIVRASMMLLGDEMSSSAVTTATQTSSSPADSSAEFELVSLNNLAQQWMRKNAVTLTQVEHCFHFDQGHVIPIALPGNATSRKVQTINAYLAVGLASYLARGDSAFSDADARSFCEQSGCYDSPNHIRSLKGLKNRVTGSKAAGWKLTAPGLTAIADLLKQQS